MDKDPTWTEILNTIYRENIVWSPDADFDEEHPVVSAVELNVKTVQENLAMLSQSGLVGRVHVGIQADIPRPEMESVIGISDGAKRQGTHVGLTARGFHVAHEREVMEQEQEEQDRRIQSQNEINSAIGFLTLGLLFINFTDTWITALLDSSMSSWSITMWSGLLANSAVILALAVLLYQTGLLDPDSLMKRRD
ncbi:hypothetical protein [Halomontanus rarus]|uniref:hypothetical protein n=1 Tax=Halomontanus rarus TaxID=3034020 RepID=UPI0023E8AC8B|nr:hypothetical protein [Halovivax sp. TS33]